MPVFVIERRYAEKIDPNAEDVREINEINADEDVRWLMSFLSADKRKTYCLYEAPTEEAIREAARRNGIPADAIVEVGELHPEEIVAGAAGS
jgi:ferredoxin-NADP reductase